MTMVVGYLCHCRHQIWLLRPGCKFRFRGNSSTTIIIPTSIPTKIFQKSQLGLIFTFGQKGTCFWWFLCSLSSFFWAFLPKRNVVPFFWNAGTAGFQGIPRFPAGMHNLVGRSYLICICTLTIVHLIVQLDLPKRNFTYNVQFLRRQYRACPNQNFLRMVPWFHHPVHTMVKSPIKKSDNGLTRPRHHKFISWKPVLLKSPIDFNHPTLLIEPIRSTGFHHLQPENTQAQLVDDVLCL